MDRSPNSNHENFFLNSLSKYIKNKRGMEIKQRERENRKGGKSEAREQEGGRGQRYIQKNYRKKSE